MRAAQIAHPGTVRIEDIAVPEPGATQLRFRVEGCGVCASNLGPWKGVAGVRYPLPPGGGGHEAWGVVDAVGSDVCGIMPGERIAALSYNAYAEYDVVEQAHVVPIAELPRGSMFPGEPLACAVNVLRRAQVRAGEVVAVIGAGFLGALVVRLAVRAGAYVIAASRRPFAQGIARRMGAHKVLELGSVSPDVIAAEVAELTQGALCDCVIEAVGMQEPLDVASALTRTRGRLVIAGYHQDGPRQVNMQLWNWRGIDVINAHERDPVVYMNGMRDALALVRDGTFDLESLVTHRFRLELLAEALDATAERPDGFLKAAITP